MIVAGIDVGAAGPIDVSAYKISQKNLDTAQQCGGFYKTAGGLLYTLFEFRGTLRRRYWEITTCANCHALTIVDRNNFRRARSINADNNCSDLCADRRRQRLKIKPLKNKRGRRGGHLLAYAPTHPSAKQGFVAKHRLVVESVLGRILLPTELVHHIDCDPQNNLAENLVVVSQKEHNQAHGSLESCVPFLIKHGYLKYDKKEHKYYVCDMRD